MSQDKLFEYLFYAGLFLTGTGLLGVYWLAFRRKATTGAAVLLVPPLIPWGIARTWPKSQAPALMLVLGLTSLAIPPLYTRFAPIDLGPRVESVGGEKHITLTGWDRPAAEYRGLEAHPDCVVLQMANADVDDAVLQHVAGMSRLRELDLDNTGVSDAGLAIVARLRALERLRVSKTRITEAGFAQHLATHPTLRQLWCPGTTVSRAALDAWKQAAPGRRYITDAPAASPAAGEAETPTPQESPLPATQQPTTDEQPTTVEQPATAPEESSPAAEQKSSAPVETAAP